MIDYGPFAYAAPPRCGSLWFGTAAHTAGFVEYRSGCVHMPTPADYKGLVLSTVRNPYDWLVSYYLHSPRGLVGINGPSDWVAAMKADSRSIEHFISRCINKPGCVGAVFDSYQANTIIRLEDYPWAVMDFLEPSVSRDMRMFSIAKTPVLNARIGQPYPPNPELRAMVMRSENDFCQRYNYV